MVLFNYATKELTAKVVYYGPGLCGKTTNLQFIHENLPDTVKGKMLSLATKTDRTLFFDFLPIDLGEIRGMKTRVQLYTVPGQVFYNETRRLVLKGADGIVFVADSQETMLSANVESFRNLEENLKAHGMSLAEMPHVIQFNKRDLPRLSGIEEMNAALNKFNAPFYESVATTGIGVQDTLKAVVKLVLLHLTRKYDPKAASSPRAARPAPVMAAASKPAPASRAAEPRVSSGDRPRAADIGTQTIPLSGIPLSPLSENETVPAPPSRPAAAAPPAATPGAPSPRVQAGSPRGEARSIPLSLDSLADAPFADEEIDGLVEEVEAFTVDDAPVAEESIWLGEAEASEPALEDAVEIDSPFATADSAIGASTSVEDLRGPSTVGDENEDEERPDEGVAPEGGVQEGPFEIDRGFDPEWERAGWEGDAPATPLEPSDAPPPVDEPEEAIAESPRSSEPVFVPPEEVEDDGVYLNEVADDTELFEDPGLDVTSLSAGEAREIVVPVEIRSDGQTRRFKLSVRLRLDPVDPD